MQTMMSQIYVFRVILLLWICLNSVHTDRIDLSDQQLTTVPRTLNLDVEILILDDNVLNILNNSSFDLYPDLDVLSLKHCSSKLIEEGTFDKQVKLQMISLIHNHIRQLPITFGPSVHTIIDINLRAAYDSGYVFDYPYFRAFRKLLALDIGGRNASSFDSTNIPPSVMSFKAVRSELSTFPNFSHLQNLEILFLGINHITTIARGNIDELKQLKVLKLFSNRIGSMPNISYLPALKRVVLNKNYISYVPADTLNGLHFLKILDLSANRIAYVDDISHLSLSYLDLANNNLRGLPDLYDQKLKRLYLHDNPIVCNQSLCWLRMWPWYQTPPDVDNVVCAQPPELIEFEIMRVHPNVLDCYDGMLYVVLYHEIPEFYVELMLWQRTKCVVVCYLSYTHIQ